MPKLLNAHDEKLLDSLNEADSELYRAWKHSECGGHVMAEINKAQDIIHKLIRHFGEQ
jgi:hypothetical protein